MTLTEEQRDALDFALEYMIDDPNDDRDFNLANSIRIIQAMIDSSDHIVEPDELIGFDLERARGLRDFLQDDCAEVGDVWGEMIAEIERLRANGIAANHSELDLQLRIKELKADLEQAERVIEARLDVIDQQAARIDELEADNQNLVTLNKSLMNNDWILRDNNRKYRKRAQKAELLNKELKADLEQSERVVEARLEVIDQQAVKIRELEDALVEGLTNFLHYRASCYDPARRCPYAKECDDCSTWDACGHVEKFRSEARQLLQAEGKIGPDAAKPRSWQITEERMRAIRLSEELAWDCKVVDVLRAMLRESQ